MLEPMKNNPLTEEPSTSPSDLTKGYCVKLHVYGDGSFGVGEPEPMDDEAESNDDGDDAHIPDLTAALKRLLNVVKTNPIGDDEEAQFDAGYAAGPANGMRP